ncbi:MAG: hypothetical protein HYT21_02520 [Candidatus Nealsonbacteria bacterium]|nr:hypothetical protein [Candidatus Nealsonbacteria bacterium]
MKGASFHIARIGTAITFLWIGILIFQNPAAWAGFIQPWAANLLPLPVETIMIGTAVFDLVIGFLLLIDFLSWQAALLGSLHLLLVLTVAGINVVTVRDIAILSGTVSLVFAGLTKR